MPNTAVLNPLEGLSEEQIKNGEDYFSIMEQNLEAIYEFTEIRL